MLPDLKLEIGDKALFETNEKLGRGPETPASSFFLKAEILEGVLGILLLLGINYYWFEENPGFLGIHPHPYWFVILPIAVRYGFTAGIVSGASAFLVQIYILAFLKGQMSLIEILWGQPLVFLLVSAGVGFFGEIRRTEHVKQKNDFFHLEKNFSSLLSEYNALAKYKEKKDSEIISQEDTFSSLYKAQEKINSLYESEIYQPLIDLLKNYLSVTAASVYVIIEDKTQLKRVADLTLDSDQKLPESMDVNIEPIKEILQKGHILSINDLGLRPELLPFFKDKIMCAPIRGFRNRPIGVIIINQIPFNHLTLQTYQMLKNISDRCGASIEKARVYQITREKMVLDEKTGALTFSYLQERFNEEFSRARRYGYTLSVLIFEIQSFYGCDIKMQQEILLSFKKIIEKKLRNIDLLFHGEDRSRFILALPNTPIWGSRTVRDKLIEEMSRQVFYNENDQPISLSVIGGVASLFPTMTAYTDLLEAAMLDVKFQKKIKESFEYACHSDEHVILVLFEIMDFEKFSAKVQQNITRIIEPLLRHHLKNDDCLYMLEHCAMYGLFFSNRDQRSVDKLTKNIINEIKAFKIKPYEDKTKDLLLLGGALCAKQEMKNAEGWKKEVMEVMYNSEVMTLFRHKFDNAKEISAPLTVMVVEVADYQIFSEEKQQDIITSLSLIFQNMLGDLDIMFFDSGPSRHILFLFQIDIVEAHKMREKIINSVRSFEFKPYTYEDKSLQIEAGVAQLSESIKTPDLLIDKADDELRFVKNCWYAFQDALNKKFPMSIIAFQVLKFDKVSSAVKQDLIRFLEEIFSHYQEDSKKIFSYKDRALYLILLPATTFNTANVINMSITDEIEAFHMQPYRGTEKKLEIKSGVICYHSEHETHYQLIQEAMDFMK
ncbi:Diguanylate cyclase with GAF sensor [Candidatus Magnetomorum sp. HK-1]|nr:Diguanylate cyclase with GAF sensor [Candidatus Magnetomorum sp. HK-1]